MRARHRHVIEDTIAVLVIILVAALPAAWGISLIVGHGGTYTPSVLLLTAIRLATLTRLGDL